MGNKKNLLSIYYMFLLVVVFAICFGISSSSYAMTDDELTNYITYYFNNIPSDYTYKTDFDTYFANHSVQNTVLSIKNGINYSNYENIVIKGYYTSGIGIRMEYSFYKDGYTTIRNDNGGLYTYNGNSTTDDNILAWDDNGTWRFYDNQARTIVLNSNNSVYMFFPTIPDIYNASGNTLIDISSIIKTSSRLIDYVSTPQSTITLVSSSHAKYEFNEKNQCLVYLTGDYNIYDFDFYLQQKLWDDEENDYVWETLDTGGYYWLSDDRRR